MPQPEPANLLLSAMDDGLYGVAVPVELHAGELLSIAGSSPAHVYFPARCMICLACQSREGQRVELGLVGREGMAGTMAMFSEMSNSWDVEVQIGGLAYRVACEHLHKKFHESSRVRNLLFAFVAHLLAQTGQTCVCLAAHTAEARLARWLLATQERLEMDDLPLSHESLSEMIGVRRPTLTMVAGKLQKAGLLRLERARVRILDREALTRLACECYHILNGYLQRYTALLYRAGT